MAKKMNSFAEDFQNINKRADDKVVAFLKHEEAAKDSKPQTATQSGQPKKVNTNPIEKANSLSAEVKTKKTEPKASSKTGNSKPPKIKEPTRGKPVALFNTRIPEKMAELLDDLVYQKKKQGNPCTKQAFAIEALENYLRKECLLKTVQ